MKTIRTLLKIYRLVTALAMQKLGIRDFFSQFNCVPDLPKEICQPSHAEVKSIPKTIWIYWDNPTPPKLVVMAVKRISNLNKDHEIIFLNRDTIGNYLSGLTFHPDLQPAHRSDFIRLNLLHKYGGIWIDATTLFFNDISWVHEEKNYDLVAYYRDSSTVDYDHPVVESWFIAAPKNNHYVEKWLKTFSRINDIGPTVFINELKRRDDYSINKQYITHPEYLMLNICQQISSRDCDFSFRLKKSEDGAFYFQRLNGWSAHNSAYLLMIKSRPKNIPEVIKITHVDRELLPFLENTGLLNKRSIIGHFMSQ